MIERLYEINRVLLAVRTLSGGETETQIPIDAIVRLCRDRVIEGRLPDHELAIQFASVLGMLVIEGGEVRLLSDGNDFLSLNPQNYAELTDEQIMVLRRRQYLDGSFSEQCKRVLKEFFWDEAQQRLVWSELDDAALEATPWLLDHLCQLRVLVRTGTGYETTVDATQTVLNFIEESKGLTEEKLRQMLLEKEAVGDVGEELALAFEQNRLKTTGRVVEARCVRRISRVRVNAGYDIESFTAAVDVFDRFIEVKAARGLEIRFFWTENEMKVAEKLRDKYWIYFFGGIDATSRTCLTQPVLFQDPLHSIMNDANFSKSPQGLLVQGKIRAEQF